MFLGETVEERRRGIGPVAAEYVDLQEQFRIRVDRGVEPLCLTVDGDLVFRRR